MAFRRTVRRSEPHQGRELERLWKLQRRAQAEVARLLKRNQTGTITRVQLQTGLKEVRDWLKQMNLHFYRL
jgi:hypothetical protein